jgi:hypothetical protein
MKYKNYKQELLEHGTEHLSTDELFERLEPFIRSNGELYHFYLIKGKNVLCWYENDRKEYLGNTYRGASNLHDCLKKQLDWLLKFDYYAYESENILLDMVKQINL